MTGKSSRFSSGEMLRSCRLQSHHIEIVPLFLHKCLNSDPGPRVLHRTAADTADKDFSVRSWTGLTQVHRRRKCPSWSA